MGYIQADITPVLSFSRERHIVEITEGILYSVLLSGQIPEWPRHQSWGEIGIIGETDADTAIHAVFCSGQFAAIGRLAWTGRHPIVTGDRLYVDIYGISSSTFRLAALILQPDPNLNSMQVLDA
jgi:hypothetical protein